MTAPWRHKAAAALALGLAAPVGAVDFGPLDGLVIGNGQTATVAVFHGDMSSGGPADYLFPVAFQIARVRPETTVVAYLRPGYGDAWGRQSPGYALGRRDHYTAEAARLIADSLTRLKSDRQGAPLIAIGHSGGAAQLALALAEGAPVDLAILLACPCDLDGWYGDHPDWPVPDPRRSLDPLGAATRLPAGTRVITMTGSDDTNTRPHLAQAFVAAARSADVTYQEVRGGDHDGNRALMRGLLETLYAELDQMETHQ